MIFFSPRTSPDLLKIHAKETSKVLFASIRGCGSCLYMCCTGFD